MPLISISPDGTTYGHSGEGWSTQQYSSNLDEGIVGGAAGLKLLATTGVNGFALQNGTPTIISWTAPNDGKIHPVQLFIVESVTVTKVGGGVNGDFFAPGGTEYNNTMFNANSTPGLYAPANANWFWQLFLIEAGSTFALNQVSALTGGTATLWAEIWGY